jgi:hypothetical protein
MLTAPHFLPAQVSVAPDARLDFLRTLKPANSLAYHHHGLIAAGALGMPSGVLAEVGRTTTHWSRHSARASERARVRT